jgi:hypothetical protein
MSNHEYRQASLNISRNLIYIYIPKIYMLENFEFYLFLVLLITMLIMLAKKIQVAYPVLLVLAGLVISFIPGVPL